MCGKSTRTLLNEARETIFVNGEWVRNTSDSKFFYKLFGSYLTFNGDFFNYLTNNTFAAFNEQMLRENEKLRNDEENEESEKNASDEKAANLVSVQKLPVNSVELRERFSVLATFTYTLQFVKLIAFYLNVTLPCSMSNELLMSDQFIDENLLRFSVAQLNTNIVYLCNNFALNENYDHQEQLVPTQTLHNLFYFLNYSRKFTIVK